MSVVFDEASCTVLAVCTSCPWRQLLSSIDIAHREAIAHVWAAHPEDAGTRSTLYSARRVRRLREAGLNSRGKPTRVDRRTAHTA